MLGLTVGIGPSGLKLPLIGRLGPTRPFGAPVAAPAAAPVAEQQPIRPLSASY